MYQCCLSHTQKKEIHRQNDAYFSRYRHIATSVT
uniref:Uncharacterized protein n=1 Tax=Arundo donax TaxID=35708 RepID=A0A0A9AVN0_ARUDO